MSNVQTIRIECTACGGTGLYRGMAEPEGVAVVCLECNGTGGRDVDFTPFTKRRERKGVHTVCRSRGSLIVAGVGPVGDSISYEEFVDGKIP